MCSLIYFALPILLFIAPFTHVLPRPPRRRRGRFIVPVPTKFHKMALHICIVGVAIRIISTHQNHLVRLKNGRDESAPTPCGVFAAIHLRNK